ncbi:cellulose synthase complex outer membrane protein BcsC [Pseudomonas fluorescens]|uniref:Cellulose synthase operon protein C n=1 Tax=Pseudomonas fluorescens TaxID=294 RepID=A0A5E7U8K3_PSEFL|nr:cellulose synthase complex outer membrane protein BcsC [Pseudomonas fluorescens]VVQ07672.1 Cellulose synthase operon protein C [Pseudomonas fluorescens]
MQRLVLRKTAAKTFTLRSLLTCGTLLSSLYLCPSILAAQAPGTQQAQQQWLLQQMRVGEAMYREELINDSLARLDLIAPNHPQVLVGKIRQALRTDPARQDPAMNAQWIEQLLTRLRLQAPGSPELRQALALVKLQSDSGVRDLQQARLLAAAGRFDEATAAYEQLFGNDPPDLASAVEYWNIRSRLPGQHQPAVAAARNLDNNYPGSTSLRQMLVGLLFAEDRDNEALAVLHQLAADPLASAGAAETEYNYLARLPVSPDTAKAWQDFTGYYPYSPLTKEAARQLAEQRRLLADPAWLAGSKAKVMLENNADPVGAEALLRRALKAYPQDPSLHGALGVSLMRQSKYAAANEAVSRALSLEQDTFYMTKWRDLQQASRLWMVLQKGNLALEAKNLPAARVAFTQARTLDSGNTDALIGLSDVAIAESDDIAAEALLLQVRKLEPDNASAVRRLVRLYQAQSSEKAEAFLDTLPTGKQAEFTGLRQSIQLERLSLKADAATERSDWAQLGPLLKQMRVLDPDNPWLAYRLAGAELALGKPAEADDAFRQLLSRQGNNPEARYAHALYLSTENRDREVLASLRHIPKAGWTDNMRDLAARIERRQLLAQAEKLRDTGHEPEAIALLLRKPTVDDLSTLADWAFQREDYLQAQHYYLLVLKQQPQDYEAQLGLIETWIATARQPQAREALDNLTPPAVPTPGWQRRVANAWASVGEPGRANALYAQLLQTPQTDPLIYRDAARLMAKNHPQQALDNYARSMTAAGLTPSVPSIPRDNVAMTEASRANDGDDWMLRSLRADVDELYQQQNPSVNLYQDFAWRTDNTAPGISDLTTQTTILRIDAPFAEGQGFVQAEQVDLQATRFDTNDNGRHQEAFGTCALATGGCPSTSLSTSGPGLAVGWKNAAWAADLGHSPQGFEIGNWLGGVSYSSDWQSVGWTLTASRRPMSNSVVSYAGAVDPLTGTRWGGVTSNGLTLSLSHDEGGVDGVWASLGAHRLLGKNVEDNQRLSAMGGYYYRLVDTADERMRTGLTLMYWGYDKDLSEYTLGQGGYYSPQQYYSIGVPLNYAWRDANWSATLESSVGWSYSKTSDSVLYPHEPVGSLQERLNGAGFATDSNPSLTKEDSSSNGIGIRLQALVERRLSNNLVLGSGITYQHSEGYAPSRALLYLRYTFDEWQGNLPMPIEPVTPYGDMR